MIWRIVLILLVLVGGAQAFDLAVVVGDDTTYASANVFNRDVRVFFNEQFSYTVHVISDDSALAVANWSTYDGIFISAEEAADLSALADATIPIVCLDESEKLKLASTSGHTVGGTTFQLVKELSDHFIVNYSMDTLWLGHAGNAGISVLSGLAAGAQNPWNHTSYFEEDSGCVVIAETGATLTSGSAPARRAFIGVFYSASATGEYTTQSACHAWELLGNVSAWVYGDTLNATWWSDVCFTDKLEVNACWGEFGVDGNRTYNSNIRLGIDPSVTGAYGDGLTFFKIWPEALKTKIRPEFATIEACSLDNYVVKVIQIDNETSGYDFDMKSHKISVADKWRAPLPAGGGYNADSTWVNRVNVIGGPDSVTWADTNLVSGTDYDAEVGDSLRLTDLSIGDTINLTIPADWVQGWYSDTSTCNGVVYVSYVAEDNHCEDAYCDVEIQPYTDSYNDQYPPYTHVWRVTTSATTGWTGDDVTPSIKTGNYLTGADHISDTDVFQRTTGDDSTFFQRWEYLVGIGDGMEAYLDEMIYYGCWTSNYVSGTDMPNDHGLTGQEPTYNQLGKKHDFITGDAVGEKYWMHYHDDTEVENGSSDYTITGTGSMTVTDGDSTARVNHYASKWSGNTYTYPTRPIFNPTDSDARNDYTSFIQAMFGDSSDTWYSGKTCTGDSHYVALYLDNFDSTRLISFTANSGGAIIELDSAILGTEAATNAYWSGMKTWLSELRSTVTPVFADSLQIAINIGSSTWSYDYIYDMPRGTMLNLEFGLGPLQIRANDGADWPLDSIAVWDSVACSRGISFFYCSAPWDQQSTHRHSVWDYHGFSTAAWSVYMRMAYYQAVKSDSSILYCMPAMDGAYYQGYAFDGHSTPYYDWDDKATYLAAADFDTMSWQDCFEHDIGDAVGMLELDSSYFYVWNENGHTAKIFKREYDSAWVFVRPVDDTHLIDDHAWGRRADSVGIGMTVELPDTCKLLLPDNTLTDSAFVWYEMNPGDGFVFIKATEQAEPEPAASGSVTISNLTLGRITIK